MDEDIQYRMGQYEQMIKRTCERIKNARALKSHFSKLFGGSSLIFTGITIHFFCIDSHPGEIMGILLASFSGYMTYKSRKDWNDLIAEDELLLADVTLDLQQLKKYEN